MLDEKIKGCLLHELQDYSTDYSVSALLAALLKQGISSDQLIIQSESTSKRPYRKEVSQFHTEIFDYDNKEYLFLHTHQDGIYDALPEGIFHQPTGGRTEKNKYEAIEEIKKHREEEKMARLFFLPLEHEFQQVKTLLYQIEEDFERQTLNSKLVDVFSTYWPVLKNLDLYPAYIFLRIAPLIHAIRNDLELAAKSIGLILGTEIKLSLSQFSVEDEGPHSFTLGGGLLGINTVIGDTIADGEYDVKVEVGPLNARQIRFFSEGGKYSTVLDELLDFFLGGNYYFHKELLVTTQQKKFDLTEAPILGISAYL